MVSILRLSLSLRISGRNLAWFVLVSTRLSRTDRIISLSEHRNTIKSGYRLGLAMVRCIDKTSR